MVPNNLQQLLLETPNNIVITSKRQEGKTTGLVLKLFQLLVGGLTNIMVVSPNSEMSERFRTKVLELLPMYSSLLALKVVRNSKERLVIQGWSHQECHIYFLCNTRAICGQDPDATLIDEFDFIGDIQPVIPLLLGDKFRKTKPLFYAVSTLKDTQSSNLVELIKNPTTSLFVL